MIAALLALATLFGGLSLLAFGGGSAVTAAIERAATANGWATPAQFLALFALSRSAPGPGSLIAALVGQRAAGVPGAIVATLAMYLPSSILVSGAARVWRRYEAAHWRYRLEKALVPVAVGLTIGSALVVARHNDPDAATWTIVAVATAVLALTKCNPLVVLAAGGAVGVAVF